jgi:tripartite-type tricarboxylate transporter receptor subunit TctC
MPARLILFSAAFFAACVLSSSGQASDPAFYAGKRLTVLINFEASGPTDIEGRLFVKYVAKNLDGQPPVIVQNMDGAGGLIGT